MLNYLKKLWQTSFPAITSDQKNKSIVQTSELQPNTYQSPVTQDRSSPTLQPNFYLDEAWALNKKKQINLALGTKLWHGGLIGPNKLPTNSLGLWTTRNQQNSTFYDAWASEGAKKKGLKAYNTEFETNKDLLLADFNCYSLNPFTLGMCDGHHSLMKQALMNWLEIQFKTHGIRGIISINGGVDQVVICFPENDVNVVQHTQI